jgi:hypothetical protein
MLCALTGGSDYANLATSATGSTDLTQMIRVQIKSVYGNELMFFLVVAGNIVAATTAWFIVDWFMN